MGAPCLGNRVIYGGMNLIAYQWVFAVHGHGRQAGRHDWVYYTSTKCAIPDDMGTWHFFSKVAA